MLKNKRKITQYKKEVDTVFTRWTKVHLKILEGEDW